MQELQARDTLGIEGTPTKVVRFFKYISNVQYILKYWYFYSISCWLLGVSIIHVHPIEQFSKCGVSNLHNAIPKSK